MIPALTDEGLLPPGIHEGTVEELREKLGWSQQRRRLISGLERALELMRDCGVERVYLDGSFVTDKDRPGDIDGCYDIAQGANPADLQSMYPIFPPTPLNRDRAKEEFGAEFFPAAATEGGSGQPFLDFFRRDRKNRERGVVLIQLTGEAQ